MQCECQSKSTNVLVASLTNRDRDQVLPDCCLASHFENYLRTGAKANMRILVVHNRYQQAGGEDVVVRAETSLLSSRGHEVETFQEDNVEIVNWSDAALTTVRCVYSYSAARDVRKLIARFQPDVAHIHNFFPRVSPSVHYACLEASIPIVQTLHNYRLLCPGSTFLRDQKVCEDCLGKAIPWPAVQHGCYRKSRFASAAMVNMLTIHRALQTWQRTVSRFIAPTQFARSKFIEGGLPEGRIVVKPNFVTPDPGMGPGNGGYVLFVGRLSEEKGLNTLLAAWSKVSPRGRLKIVGDGPMAAAVEQASSTNPSIEWLGTRSRGEVLALMSNAALLVFPSIGYETFGLTVIEAFATGLPVFASRLGAMAELVSDGETGKLFTAGSSDELAAAINWALSHPDLLNAMRIKARHEFERKYTADLNYTSLTDIYQSALGSYMHKQVPEKQLPIVLSSSTIQKQSALERSIRSVASRH
jgi:glycosyltransferase involved in cell wall biosynthesis